MPLRRPYTSPASPGRYGRTLLHRHALLRARAGGIAQELNAQTASPMSAADTSASSQTATSSDPSATGALQSAAPALRTLCIDIGGTGIKMIVLDDAGRPISERTRWLTPQPASPRPMLDVMRQ